MQIGVYALRGSEMMSVKSNTRQCMYDDQKVEKEQRI